MSKKMLKAAMSCCLLFVLLAAGAFYIQAVEPISLKDAIELAKNGKQNEAIAAIKKIIDQDPGEASLEAHLSLGVVYFKSRQYDNALEEFKRSVVLRADTPMAYYFMGLIYEEKAKSPGISGIQSREFKEKALSQWQAYLDVSDRTTTAPSESHKHIGLSKADSIARAKQHIRVLTGELKHEKN